MSLDLDAIKARLASACPGPWKGFTFRRPIDGNCYVIVREDDPHVIAATLVPQYGDNDTAAMLLHSRADMEALVAEVERQHGLLQELNAKMKRIMLEAERHRRIADEAIDRQDVQLHAERAAVVAWLHEKAQAWSEDILDSVATDIDCGEHRREEGE